MIAQNIRAGNSFGTCLAQLFHFINGLGQLRWLACMCAQLVSHVQLFVTPWTVTHEALLSLGFFRQAYWSGLPFPSPRDWTCISYVSCMGRQIPYHGGTWEAMLRWLTHGPWSYFQLVAEPEFYIIQVSSLLSYFVFLCPWTSKCGQPTSSIAITWELVKLYYRPTENESVPQQILKLSVCTLKFGAIQSNSGCTLKRFKSKISKRYCMPMFIAALFTIANR